jgi:hypothetical protein
VSHDCLVSALVRQNRDETVHGGGVYETNYDCEVDLAVALQGGLGPRLLQQLARAKAVGAGDGQVPAKVWQKLDVGGYTLRYAPGDARRKTYDVLVFEWLEGEVKYSVDFHVVPEGTAAAHSRLFTVRRVLSVCGACRVVRVRVRL